VAAARRKSRVAQKSAATSQLSGSTLSILPLIASGLAIAVYLGALSFPFVFDDLPQILRNPRVQAWFYLPQYFTHSLWSHLGTPDNYYRPLFLVWMLLNFKLFGTDPEGWHFAGLVLHAVVTWLVYRVAVRDLQDKLAAGFAAIIFALHPIHVESVAWVAGLNEPLYAAFFLSTLLCYFRWRAGNGQEWLAASLACFACSMLAKETALVTPLMIFLYEWMRKPKEGAKKEGAREEWSLRMRASLSAIMPYAVVVVVYLGARTFALRATEAALGNRASPASLLLTLPAVLWFYVKQLVYPGPMAEFYPLTFVSRPGAWNVLLPLLGLMAAGVGLWIWARTDQRVKIACGWLLIPLLLPLLGIVRFRPDDLVHDRYLYLPSVGFSMLAAIALRRIPAGDRKLFGIPAAQAAALTLLGVVLGFTTVRQTDYWSSDLALYSRAVEVSPDNVLALNQLGAKLSSLGEDDRAVFYLERADHVDHGNHRTLLLLGTAENNVGHYNLAIAALLHALELYPNDGAANFDLGVAQVGAKRLSEAEASLRRAIQLVPGKPGEHYVLGTVLMKEGRVLEAREEFLNELKVDPASSAQARIHEIDATLLPTLPQ
jgi:protein O-mannosyl-transferase